MAVSEKGGSVVFLRKVQDGASENSYGIHVAQLAGIPHSVIARANQILERLQTIAGERPVLDAPLETAAVPAEQKTAPSLSAPGLFSDEEMVLDEILSADPDNMTPLAALQMVSRWKKTLSGR